MPRNQADYKVDVALMKADIASLKTDVSDIKGTLKEFVKSADDKYASKVEVDLKFASVLEKVSNNKEGLAKVADVLIKIGPYVAIVVYIVLQKVI